MNQFTAYRKVLADELASNPQFTEELQRDPRAALDKVEQQARQELPDTWIYRIVVLSLGITVVSTVIGVLIVMALGHFTGDASIPTILTAIGSAAVGALAGLLAPTPA